MVRKANELGSPPLVRLLGDSAIIRVLDYITTNGRLDYTKSDIARGSGVGWKTIFRVWPVIAKYKLVKMTRQIGRAQLYSINENSTIAKTLHQLSLQIADFDNEPLIKEQLKKELIEVA